MRWPTLAIASCAIVVLATSLDAGAAGERGAVAISRAHAAFGGPVAPHHFYHPHTRVFVGGTFFVAPRAAYYPYVQDCPGGWQLVPPDPGYY